MPAFPVSSLDPFADDFLAAPYPFYTELRDAGPAVWLERYGLWACARHAEVQAALSDWQTKRADLRPGLTGPWQISGRSHIPFQDMIKFDYQYVAGWSLARDVEILHALADPDVDMRKAVIGTLGK